MKNAPIKIADGFDFAEGPLWHPNGFLLISDTGANCIKQINEHGEISTFLANSGCDTPAPHANTEKLGSNGLKWNTTDHALVLCRQGKHCIATYENGNFTTITERYQNRPYNSPNDLVIASNGDIYFTDPPYGLEGEDLLPAFRQPLAGLYVWQQGKVKLLFDGLKFPNGVCLSPNEDILYVSSNHPDEPFIYKKNLVAASSQFEVFTPNNADGILCDADGNIYTASGDYIHKFNAAGIKLTSYFIGEATSNITLGGHLKKDLYITCYHSVWKISDIE